MDPDAVLLARIQFAFTVSFHIIFPSFTIGLAAFIATLLVRWRMTGQDHLHRLARFWTKIFAGRSPWASSPASCFRTSSGPIGRFSVVAGNVTGPLLGYEVLTAFFLEASFLGIMLFGWNRVSPNLHVTAAVLVAIGTSLSAFWILAANSWMHTRRARGHQRHRLSGELARDHLQPQFPYVSRTCSRRPISRRRSWLRRSRATCPAGLSRKQDHAAHGHRHGRAARAVAARDRRRARPQHGPTSAGQGRRHGSALGRQQARRPRAVRVAQRNRRTERLRDPAIPNIASFIITHDMNGLFKGLKDFAPQDRPPVKPVFFAFRVMVGLGMLMIAAGLVGAFLWWRGLLFDARWYLWPLSLAWPAGFIAILAGWWVTETGRQPWLVYGILRTADAASPVSGGAVLTTLIAFVIVYSIVFSMGIYYINRLIEKGPTGASVKPPDGVPSRPLSAAEEAAHEAIEKKG